MLNSERATPPCDHFGACGGCVAQHMGPTLYAAWKRDLLSIALARHAVTATIEETIASPPASRRRLVLTAIGGRSAPRFGFHRRRSSDLVDITQCTIADPRIVRALPALRTLAAILAPSIGEVRLTVTATRQGLDVSIERAKDAASIPAAARQAAVSHCAPAGIVRLTVDRDPVATLAEPLIDTPAGPLAFPPGAFVQAVADAEAAIAALITQALLKSKTAADLFCGIGTFTFAAAKHARTLAFDADRAAIDALKTSARRIMGIKPVDARVRDLFAEPLSPMELKGFDAVVLDPPRAGAKAQCEAIAASRVPRVVMVSCNPATLARDLATLTAAGFRIERLTPIDQFLWSPHLEAVAVLQR
jgi:23S rRNA (uracil1939-C5)-methyltransferase